MSKDEILISIVVLNYNGAHLLPDCLTSLQDQIGCDYEIIVVDNASTDNSRDVVSRYSSVRWLPLPTNAGLGPGYNAGAREARGKYIFFVNNDMRFEPDCLLKLSRGFSEDDIFAVDPLEFDWEGKTIIHGAQTFQFPAVSQFGVPFILPVQDYFISQKKAIAWGCAGAMMVEKKKFDSLGGFDSTFFLDYEDLDLCWRAGMRGWKTIFAPDAQLYHKVGESEDSKMALRHPDASKHSAPINFRRLVSQCKNSGRFILKVMPWPLILLSGFILMGKILFALLCGKWQSFSASWAAFCLNAKELPEIFKIRSEIMREKNISSWQLLTKQVGAKP